MKVKCDCECHEPGVVTIHAIPCCKDGFIETINPKAFQFQATDFEIAAEGSPPGPFDEFLKRRFIDGMSEGLLASATVSSPISVDLDTPGAKNLLDWFKYDPMVVTFGRISYTADDGSEPPPDVALLVMPADFIGKQYRLTPTTHEVDRPREKPLPPAMKVSQLIEQLIKLKDENGDLPVVVSDYHGAQSYPLFDFATRACRLPDESSAIVIGSVFLANPAIA